MKYESRLRLLCPYCQTQCQFDELQGSQRISGIAEDIIVHAAHYCVSCGGIIATVWEAAQGGLQLCDCYPGIRKWSPRIDIFLITNKKVRHDFEEAIKCYNHELHNACMAMARRAIQQEMLAKKIEGDNLYEQIEETELSANSKQLLHKIKDFGNHAVHPDFGLFDDDGKESNDDEKLAKLSLDFLDKYFMDVYEIPPLVSEAPKTKQELKKKK